MKTLIYFIFIYVWENGLLPLAVVLEHRSLLIVFKSLGSLLQLCLSIWSLLLSLAVSICNQILHYIELSLEVQGGQDYFRFVEGTGIIVLYLSSLSLFYPLHLESEHHFRSCTLTASDKWFQ